MGYNLERELTEHRSRGVVREFFKKNSKLIHGVPIACRKYGLDHNNNPAERYNEDIRQRSKISRGFESMEPTDVTLEPRRVVHNFAR